MFNSRDLGHNYFDSRKYKKGQNTYANDPRSDVNQNSNTFESMNERFNALSTKTEESHQDLETKLSDLDIKLMTSCEEKKSLELQFAEVSKNFDKATKLIERFSSMQSKFEYLTLENDRLTSEVTTLKQYLKSHLEMRDKEFNLQLTSIVEQVQKSVAVQIKELKTTIAKSYHKKSISLRDMISKMSVKESIEQHKDVSVNYSYGNSSHGFDNASDTDEEDDASSASSREGNSNVNIHETSPVKPLATVKKSQIKAKTDITDQTKPSVFAGLNMASNLAASPFNLSKQNNVDETTNVDNSKTKDKIVFGGNTSSEKPSIFGTNKSTCAQTPINASKPTASQSLFSTCNPTATQSIFGANTPSAGLFGTTNNDGKSSLFGGNKPSETSSSFGLNQKEENSMFSGIKTDIKPSIFAPKNTEEKSSIFGGNKPMIFGGVTTDLKAPLFGLAAKSAETESQAPKELCKPSICAPRILTNIGAFTFGDKSKEGDKGLLFGSSDNVPSFGSLAVSNEKGFGSVVETTWQSGSKLFSKATSKEEGESVQEDEEHDPEFKPIIELPPLIEIVRDDDQKDVLFKNRCKLYRFINNEWKERGVGDMKILRSVKDGVVTMVMRREQVHKICCNQRVTRDSHKMASMGNDKSACWVGSDFSEGETSVEKFAVKFGDKAYMEEFTKVIGVAQAAL